MTLKLYGGARSRASMPRWYLEEKGIAYEWIQLDMEAGEHKGDTFGAINPFAKVPALVDETLRAPSGKPLQLFESGAILLWQPSAPWQTSGSCLPMPPWPWRCLCLATGSGNSRS